MNINFVSTTWNLDGLGINFLLIIDKRMVSQKRGGGVLDMHFPRNYILFDEEF